ncbi:MAG: hypothetical protein ACYC8T_07130 [Myxococcaceae bacterium]
MTPGLEPGTLQVTFAPRAAQHIAFRVEPTTAAAATDLQPAVEVAIMDPFGNVVPTVSTEVTLLLDPPGPLPVTKLTTTSGVAVFQGLRVDAAGEYHLLASSIDFGRATSAAFTISSGAATGLGFVAQPQSGQAGATLPVVRVAIQDPGGNTVPGATTPVTLASSGPGLTGTLTVAAVDGVAQFTDLAISTAGAGLTLTATASGLPPKTSAPFTVSGAGPASVRFSVQPSSSTAGAILSPAVVVRVEDAFGNLSSGFAGSVSLSIVGGGAPGGTPVVSAAGGVATFSSVHLDTAGTYVLRAAAGTLVADSGSFTIQPAAASRLAYLTQPVSGLAGAPLAPPIRVAVQDPFGNTVSQAGSITVSLANNPPAATLGGTLSGALVAGVASFDNLTVSAAGTGFTLSATGGGFTQVSSAFDISPAGSNQLGFTAVVGQATAGVALTNLSVRTLDASGGFLVTNNVNITLTLAEGPAGATLTGTLSALTQAGVAQFTDVRLDKAGAPYALQAQAAGYASARSSNFGVSPGPLDSLRFDVNPQATAVAGATLSPPMQVSLLDAFSNPVTETTAVTLGFASAPAGGTLGGGPATVNSVNGVATFGGYLLEKAGDYQFRASTSTAVVVAGNHTLVSAAPADRVRFMTQPLDTTAVGSIPSFAVEITDAFGNRAEGLQPTLAVTVAIESSTPPGSTTLNGTTTVVQSSGVATFSGLSIHRAASYTLGASASGLSPAVSAGFAVSPGPPHHLELTQNPSAQVTSLLPINPAVVVRVRDQHENPAPGLTGIMMSLLNGNGAVLGGTTTQDASTGVSTFADLTVDKAGGPYNLSATATGPGVAGATGPNFDVRAGSPTSLTFQGSPASTTAGSLLSPVVVKVLDQAGNVAAIPAVTVDVSLGGPGTGGTLNGTLSVSTSGGLASFTTLWVNRVGTYHLDAASVSLGGAASGFFGIEPGVEYKFGFTQQPTSTNVNELIAPAPVVTVYDEWDNVATGAAGEIFLELSGSSGTLKGTLVVAPVDGAASFPDLTIDTPGYGLALKASPKSAGVLSATSAPFDVRSGAVRLQFASAPPSVVAGTCLNALTVRSVDAKGIASAVAEEHTLRLDWVAPATGSFKLPGFALCNNTTNTVKILSGASQASFHFRPYTAGSPVISVTDLTLVNTLAGTSQAQSVSAASPTRLVFDAPPARARDQICSCGVVIHTTDAWGNRSNVLLPTPVSLSSSPLEGGDGGLAFYASCGAGGIDPLALDGGGSGGSDAGTPITSVTVPSGSDTALFHFAGPPGLYSVALDSAGYPPASQPETVIVNRPTTDTCSNGSPALCLPDGGTCVRGNAGLRCYPGTTCPLTANSCVLSGEACTTPGNCCSGRCCGGVCQKAGDICGG